MKHHTQFANDLVNLERFRKKLLLIHSIGRAAEIEKRELEMLVVSEKAELIPLLSAAIIMFKDGDHVGNKHSFTTKHAILLATFDTRPKKKHEEDRVDALVG